jgi:large subunit ribosomal protein L35
MYKFILAIIVTKFETFNQPIPKFYFDKFILISLAYKFRKRIDKVDIIQYYTRNEKLYLKNYILIEKNSNFMPKLKTRKATAKRYKITGNQKFLRRHAFKGHLLMKKSKKQKRKLSQFICVKKVDTKAIKLMLPY